MVVYPTVNSRYLAWQRLCDEDLNPSLHICVFVTEVGNIIGRYVVGTVVYGAPFVSIILMSHI